MKAYPARLFGLIFFLIAPLLLSGCITLKDPEGAQDNRADIVGQVSLDQSIGQIFLSNRSKLNSIQLYLSVAEKGSEPPPVLLFELFPMPDDSQALLSIPIHLAEVDQQFPLTISFPPLNNSAGQLYRMQIQAYSGSYRLYGSQNDNYAHGTLHINGLPQPGDLSFALGYAYQFSAFMEDLFTWLSHIWLVIPLLLTLWLPGSLLLHALLGSTAWFSSQDSWNKFALSVGTSLAIIPIFFLWTTTLNIQLTQVWILLITAVSLVLRIWQSREFVKKLRNLNWKSNLHWDMFGTSLMLIFILSLGIRLVMVRDLAAPAWVDSVHHATLVRLILEQGAYPDTYQPLIPASTANYHAGYHTVMAVFTWLSGLQLPRAMLIFGQVLNALCVIMVYLFTSSLTGNRKAALFSALICGVFTPMPAYLASWGRYTHLTGMLILPAAYTLFVQRLPAHTNSPISADKPPARNERIKWLWMTALATAGLFLTHYQVAAFLAGLLIAQVGVSVLRNLWQRSGKSLVFSEIGWIIAAGIFAFIISLPWWPETLSTLFLPRASNSPSIAPFNGFSWSYLTSASGIPMMVLAGLGLVIAVLRLRWFGTITYVWIGLMFLLANLGAFGLPFSTFVNHISVEITLFIPISALGGYALDEGYQAADRLMPIRFRRILAIVLAVSLITVSLLGARKLLPILNANTLLARNADLPAMQWIEEFVPENATVLINPFTWGYGLYAGNDGGFWISPLAGRRTLPPPILYGMGGNWQTAQEITERTRQAIEFSHDPSALYTFMQENQIDYLYCGVRGGVFDPILIQDSPMFELVYAQEGAWLFKRR